MTYPSSHKTVFLLDHSKDFAASCSNHIEFDQPSKSRGSGVIPLNPISKSLWTCAVESAIEYCRIVWDLHSANRLVSKYYKNDLKFKFLTRFTL